MVDPILIIEILSPSPSASAAASVAAGASAPPASAAASGPAASAKTGGTIRIACQRPKNLDPVTMIDLASYGITSQSFEFLCTLAPNATDIAPGLALSWSPDSTLKVWTFKLRQNVTWQDGTPFTSADVVATMERLVKAGNSGLKGVIAAGSAVATDPKTVTFNLQGANGNFPYLVSVFNAQTLITPAILMPLALLRRNRFARRWIHGIRSRSQQWVSAALRYSRPNPTSQPTPLRRRPRSSRASSRC